MPAATREPAPLPARWPWLVRGFQRYAARYVRRHFHAVRLAKAGPQPPPTDEPILVVLNHPSWWDPMTCVVLSRLFPAAAHYAAIDAAALTRYPIFRKLGFVGVDPTRLRGAAEFLRAGEAILSAAGRMFWVTAQGRFADVRERPLALQPGVGHLAARLTRGVVLPLALDYPFWSERTPEALVRFGDPLRVADHPGLNGRGWTTRIEAELTRTLDALAADALSRDPGRFTDLLAGRAGVGGVYGGWRRLTAWARGRRFDPSHESGIATARAEVRR